MKDAFEPAITVRAMALLEFDWQWDNYLDTIHPEYHATNPAAKKKTDISKIQAFNCNRYTAEGWNVFRERLKAVCAYLAIDEEIDYSSSGGHDADLYAMKGAITRAMFEKVRNGRPPRPFKLEDQVYRMDVKDSVIYVYYKKQGVYNYFIELPNGYDYDSKDPYDSSWQALSAGVEQLLDMPNRYPVEV